MRTRIGVAVLVAAVGMTAVPARPAQAQIPGGTLSLTVPSNPSPASGSVVSGSTVSVNLGTTTVADSRVGSLGWTVSADAVNLTDGAGHSIAKTRMSWQTKNLTAVSGLLTGVAVGAGGTFGAVPVTVAAAAGGAGLGTYTYTATVTLVVPANTVAASYTTTITQTAV